MNLADAPPSSIHILDGTIADDVGRARFSNAMRDEMAKRRLEGKTGRNKPEACTIAQLEEHLNERLAAGDIMGVGIAAMMIHNRAFPEPPR